MSTACGHPHGADLRLPVRLRPIEYERSPSVWTLIEAQGKLQ